MVERVAAVDWSGDRSAAGQRRKLWAGVWTKDPTHATPPSKGRSSGTPDGDKTALHGAPGVGRVFGGSVTLESGRTREELREWLIAAARETPRMVVGVEGVSCEEAEEGCSVCCVAARGDREGAGERRRVRCAGFGDGDG